MKDTKIYLTCQAIFYEYNHGLNIILCGYTKSVCCITNPASRMNIWKNLISICICMSHDQTYQTL